MTSSRKPTPSIRPVNICTATMVSSIEAAKPSASPTLVLDRDSHSRMIATVPNMVNSATPI